MLLAFSCDQLQSHACQLVRAARKKVRVKKTMWEMMRSILILIDIPNWETLWRLIIDPSSEKATLVLLNNELSNYSLMQFYRFRRL